VWEFHPLIPGGKRGAGVQKLFPDFPRNFLSMGALFWSTTLLRAPLCPSVGLPLGGIIPFLRGVRKIWGWYETRGFQRVSIKV